jgi:PAS domain S-box-containing protein
MSLTEGNRHFSMAEKLEFTLRASGMVAVTDHLMRAPIRSPELCKLLGIKPEDRELDYDYLLSLMHPADRERLTAKDDQDAQGKTPVKEYVQEEVRFRHQEDGSTRHIQIKGIKVSRCGEEKRGYFILEDITSQRELENRLRRFSAIVAHDLKNPLSSIAMTADLLDRKTISTEANELVRRIRDRAKGMADLIDDLLTTATLESGEHDREQVGIANVITDARLNLEAAMRESHGSVQVLSYLPMIYGVRVQLTQLFQNLLANAVKFRSETPPCVSISAKEFDGHWEFSVRDNGIGMSEEQQKCIFEPFVRTQSDLYDGTGLGLSICKKIVEHHHGEISVHSTPKGGSEFIFTLAKL